MTIGSVLMKICYWRKSMTTPLNLAGAHPGEDMHLWTAASQWLAGESSAKGSDSVWVSSAQ
jgi:hypothetical protein